MVIMHEEKPVLSKNIFKDVVEGDEIPFGYVARTFAD